MMPVRMTWIQTIGFREATGDLAAVYERMRSRPLPSAYVPPHGDAAGIVRAHSLDPELLAVTFGVFGVSVNRDGPLDWGRRELINAYTSRANQCFY
jgi:hypothetical protein